METETTMNGMEEVAEAITENVTAGKSSTALAVAGGMGIAAGIYIICRFAVKPLINKITEKRNSNVAAKESEAETEPNG